MKAFWIFACILTIAYIIYYVVNICLDLYRKPKDQPQQMAEEGFDLRGMQSPEEPKAVEKTDGGFRVAQSSGEGEGEKWNETVIQSKEEQPTNPDSSSPAPMLDATGAVMTPTQQKIEDVKNQMEEIDVQMSNEMALNMLKSMINGGEDTPIATVKNPDEPINNTGTNEIKI